MNKEQIEKYIALGRKKKLDATKLSQLLTQSPHNLCAADASVVYYEFRKRHGETRPTCKETQAARNVTVNAVNTKLETHKCKSVSEIIQRSAESSAAEVRETSAGYTPSKLNRSAVKAYALDFSNRTRAGKFKRVSPSWVKGVEAELENVIRSIGGPEDSEELPGEWDFLNRKQIVASVFEQLNRAVRKIILRKVRSHPSKGQTLK